jgi:hypothetical protein
MINRCFLIIAGFTGLAFWFLSALYGILQFWNYLVVRLGEAMSNIIGLCIIAVIVLWVILLFKYIKREM